MTETSINEHKPFIAPSDMTQPPPFIPRRVPRYGSHMKNIKILNWEVSVGPDYKFFFCAFGSMLIIATAMLILQLSFKVSFLYLALSIGVNVLQLASYVSVLISDPGIPKQSVHPDISPKPRYCAQCEIFVEKGTLHCNTCNVCVQNLDHHCPWTSKCIGKNNLSRFYAFVGSTLVFIMYNTVAIPLAIIDIN